MDQQHLEYLFEQHDSNRITEAERKELYDFLGDFQNKEDVFDSFQASLRKTAEDTAQDKDKWNFVIEKILASPQTPLNTDAVIRRIFPWRRIAAAAAIIIMVSAGYFLFFNKKNIQRGTHELAIKKDVEAPKGTRAVITLGNGQNVSLDSIANGTLATQGNVNVNKTDDGHIVYSGTAGEAIYNTLTNPKGSNVVDITLADGSRVWLNAGSSVTYPVAFGGNERRVQVTGEAYFEVAHNAAMPFVVQKNDVSVLVLGTHFNVNTYDDEADIKITLLQGSVKVMGGNKTGLLKPGQQALLNKNREIKIITDADVDQVMAWKNGVFIFRNTNIEAIMRQVARWYDVEIVYNGNFADLDFGGTVSRKANVSELLKRLEATEAVHFNVEGRKITVMH